MKEIAESLTTRIFQSLGFSVSLISKTVSPPIASLVAFLSITPYPYSMSILARWDVLFAMSDVRILLYLEEKGQARYSELLGRVLNSKALWRLP